MHQKAAQGLTCIRRCSPSRAAPRVHGGHGSNNDALCDKSVGLRGSGGARRVPKWVLRDFDILGSPFTLAVHGKRWARTRTRMSKDTYTAVSEDGLRYESKLGGSPFLGSGHTRSCFKCGKHRPPSALQSKRVLAMMARSFAAASA